MVSLVTHFGDLKGGKRAQDFGDLQHEPLVGQNCACVPVDDLVEGEDPRVGQKDGNAPEMERF